MAERRFFVCSVMPDGSLEMSPTVLSPEAAARRDVVAFLAFAEKVSKLAAKLQGENGQLRLFSEGQQNGL